MAAEKKDGKINIFFFFLALLQWWERRKQKQGGGEMIREAMRKMENTVIIIVAFLSGLCLIGLNMAFRHLPNIYLRIFDGRV